MDRMRQGSSQSGMAVPRPRQRRQSIISEEAKAKISMGYEEYMNFDEPGMDARRQSLLSQARRMSMVGGGQGSRRPSIGGQHARRQSMMGGQDRRQSLLGQARRQSMMGQDRRQSMMGSMGSLMESGSPSTPSIAGQGPPQGGRRMSLMGQMGGGGGRQSRLASIVAAKRCSMAVPIELSDEEEEEEEEESQSEQKSEEEKKIPAWKLIKEPLEFKCEFHKVVFDYTESKAFTGFIMFIILLNTIVLISQTWRILSVRMGWYFVALDNVFLGIYLMEIILKLYVWRLKFFKVGWNIMDLSIVVFNMIDFVLPLILTSVGGFNGAAIFRLLRIFRAVRAIRALRVLRTIRFLSNLQVIMTTIFQSVKSIGAISALIVLVMYMFAVIGRGLYSEVDPDHFGNLLTAGFTLFQLLTLDDWFDINKNVTNKGRPDIFFYLFVYIVLEYFIFLNLFVAVLVDNFQLTLKSQNEANKRKKKMQDDSDDEEDYTGQHSCTDASTTYSNEVKPRKSFEEHFPDLLDLTDDQKETYRQYHRLMASLEYNMHVHADQQRLLNIMVDMCAENTDDLL